MKFIGWAKVQFNLRAAGYFIALRWLGWSDRMIIQCWYCQETPIVNWLLQTLQNCCWISHELSACPSWVEPACAICICEYEDGEMIRSLPCDHEFHVRCIDQWFTQHNTCPNCRRCLDPDGEALSTELQPVHQNTTSPSATNASTPDMNPQEQIPHDAIALVWLMKKVPSDLDQNPPLIWWTSHADCTHSCLDYHFVTLVLWSLVSHADVLKPAFLLCMLCIKCTTLVKLLRFPCMVFSRSYVMYECIAHHWQ